MHIGNFYCRKMQKTSSASCIQIHVQLISHRYY